jgi:glycosyltransferase involved in cell wall biosynthesis
MSATAAADGSSARDRRDAPRVTVVIPLHNGVRYLAQAVASVRAQTFERWEAVLVDDASTDGTRALACELAAGDPARIRVLALERNVGVAGARAAAIATATAADLVALLDQDDVLGADFLSRCVALYDERTAGGRRVAIVACNPWIVDERGRRGGTFAERYGWTDTVDYDAMIQRNCICARALFSREAYERAGGFATETQPCDDYDLWLRMLELGYEVVATRESLASYRLHAAATSRDVGRMAETIVRVQGRALARGRVTPRQRRALRERMRHHRALRERARVRAALAEGRRATALARAARALPYGAIALLQRPSRWPEWARDVLRRRGVPGGSAGVAS